MHIVAAYRSVASSRAVLGRLLKMPKAQWFVSGSALEEWLTVE